MEGKDRVLILGATGYIGRRLVKASIALGHPTFVLFRPENVSNRENCQMFMEFKMEGAHLLQVKFRLVDFNVSFKFVVAEFSCL